MRISDWSSDVCSSDLIDVVTRRAARAVIARLGLDRDRLRRAHRFAQLARDAAFLAVRIAPQHMLAAETGRQRVLLERIVDRRLRLEEIFEREGDRKSTRLNSSH